MLCSLPLLSFLYTFVRGCLKLAQQACNELGVLASSVTGVDLELKTEASFRHGRTLLAANQFSEVRTSLKLSSDISMFGCVEIVLFHQIVGTYLIASRRELTFELV